MAVRQHDIQADAHWRITRPRTQPGTEPTRKVSSTRSSCICAIWVLLFVFSAFSYMVDYFQLQGALRWTLILVFMMIKASFIVAIFMHMAWERLALKLAILVPPLALLILIALMAIEGDYRS